MTGPTVSVLVSAYNHERYVDEALDSLAAQTYGPLEVVITDDASTDGTLERIRAWLARTGFPARLIANPTNLGIPRVRNNALAATTGEFVCALASDDRMTPDRVERHVRALAASPSDVAAVVSDMRVIDASGAELSPSFFAFKGLRPWCDDEPLFDRLLGGNFLPAPAVMVRRSALDAVGPYDESLVFEDYDMWLRLADRFAFRFVPGTVVDYRVLPTSLSHRTDRIVAMKDSELRCLTKWAGRSPATDRIIAGHLFRLGREVRRFDPAVARRAFAAADRLGLSGWSGLAARIGRLPGGVGLLGAGAAVARRLRRG